MKDWALVRRLVAEGVPQRQVAKDLGLGRETVRRALASDRPPKYERRRQPTSFDGYEQRVRAVLEDCPDIAATVLAERVGWTGSMSWFGDNVRELRPDYRPPDPADRLVWEPGDVAQCDLWFPPKRIPLEDGANVLLPVLVMVLAYSRVILARMIPTRTTADLLLGMWALLRQLGKVPRRLIWDNEAGIGRGKPVEAASMFAGTLATKLVLLKPRDPESKGSVERRNGFFETSFMPARTFDSPADFNQQFSDWLTLANHRIVRTTGQCPADRLETDLAGMLGLPPAVFGLGWRNQVRLGRDYYVRLAGNDYFVDPSAIGRMIDVTGDLDRVQARYDGKLVADHQRVWARHKTITDPAHVQTAGRLRTQFQQHGLPQPAEDQLVRDLADYDKAFGLQDRWGAA